MGSLDRNSFLRHCKYLQLALAAKPTSLGAGISIQRPTRNHSTSMVPPPRRRFSPDVSLAIVANGIAPRAMNDEMTNCPGELFALE